VFFDNKEVKKLTIKVCIVGPSGVGKNFYVKLLAKEFNLARPTTVTTRNQRKDDDHHQYVSKVNFRKMIRKKELIEWDKYRGYFYGITIKNFNLLLNARKYNGIIMDLTVAGCKAIRNQFSETIIIGLQPDDISWLEKRLIERGTNNAVEIKKRVKLAKKEIGQIKKLNAPIVYCQYDSKDSSKTFLEISKIIKKAVESPEKI